jgi:transcriptional regulator with XRE-family HTH domain
MKNATIRYVIASNIERLMRAAPDVITEIGLAARTNLQQTTIRRILSGSIDVDVDTLDIIAKALQVDAAALLSRSASPVNPIEMYRDRIAALPVDQQQRIQDFIDSVSAKHEEQVIS